MNQISLVFFSNEIEIDYQKQNMSTNLAILKNILLSYGFVVLCVAIYTFCLKYWWIGILCLAYVFQLPIIYLIARRGPKHFDLSCILIQTALILGVPITYLLGYIEGPIADADSYMFGQAMLFIISSLNLGTRLYLKFIVIFINILAQMFIQLAFKQQMTVLTLFWLGSNFLYLTYIHAQDRIRREAFLTKHNEIVWQNEIGSCAQICIITCVQENGLLLLDFNKCNKISQDQFNIINEESFLLFLKNMRLLPKKYFSSGVFNQMCSEKEAKKFMSLQTWIQIFNKQIHSENSELIGLFNSCLYDIKIFVTWNQNLLNIHTLLTKSSFKPQDENLKLLQYESKLFTFFRYKFGTQIKTMIIILSFIVQSKSQELLKNQAMSVAYDALRQNFNMQIFLKPCYQCNKSYFFLSPLIKKINSIIKYGQRQSGNIKIDCQIDQNLKLFSCQKTIFHIVYNLYSIIIGAQQLSGYINITVQQRDTKIGSFITFRIATDLTSLELLMDNQNYQRNTHARRRFLPSSKKVGLELIVCEYLIGQIGPQRSIRLSDSLLSFTIFQDLKVLAK